MPEEIIQLKTRMGALEAMLSILIFSDRYVLQKDLQFQDGRRIQFGTGTGTRIGTATGQLLSFYGVTPVDQPVAVSASAMRIRSVVTVKAMRLRVYLDVSVQSTDSAIRTGLGGEREVRNPAARLGRLRR